MAWILPAVVVSLALGVMYVTAGSIPESAVILASVAPIVVAIVAHAAVLLGRSIVNGWVAVAIALAATVSSLAGVTEIAILGAGAIVGLTTVGGLRRGHGSPVEALATPAAIELPAALAGAVAAGVASVGGVFLAFLKIGALLFGSGYVLVAFLRSDLVLGAGWITERQLLDAVAIGQVTPGPVSSTATFLGYLVAGVPGAVAATLGIFLPGALFVAASIPILPRLANSPIARAALDGVNAAALGLLVAVTAGLARGALVDGVSVGLAAVAAILLLVWRVAPGWLVLGAAAIGVVRALAG
jgi:chromate transporter